MKAAVKKMGDVTVISIEGVLEIEHTQPFRQICLKKFIREKLVFNMQSANFVGSTGLQSFLDTVKTIDAANSFGLKMVGVKPEFRRLLANIETQKLSFYDEIRSAVQSFTLPPLAEMVPPVTMSALEIAVTSQPSANVQAVGAEGSPMVMLPQADAQKFET